LAEDRQQHQARPFCVAGTAPACRCARPSIRSSSCRTATPTARRRGT
jgi:hypothetical protein